MKSWNPSLCLDCDCWGQTSWSLASLEILSCSLRWKTALESDHPVGYAQSPDFLGIGGESRKVLILKEWRKQLVIKPNITWFDSIIIRYFFIKSFSSWLDSSSPDWNELEWGVLNAMMVTAGASPVGLKVTEVTSFYPVTLHVESGACAVVQLSQKLLVRAECVRCPKACAGRTYWSERSACAALRRAQAERSGHSEWHYFSSLFFWVTYFSTRKKAARVPKFCMGS